ncbi:MAG: dTDP-4-dehydrorhamnose reductase [Deltaproteobacteria bacterium]|nr:MAG: dTDP-4-dehydrorhamnose reductase [Deltaproteobacteria bacterium]
MDERIMVVGAEGMLGKDLVKVLGERYEVVALGKEELDITAYREVKRWVKQVSPRIVIDAAGYTDVDGCERRSRLAFAVNGEGAKNLARAASLVKAKVVYISTDYVFDGKKESPYTEEDPLNPLNVYGESKVMGERYVEKFADDYLIVRTQWLYGLGGRNFVETILSLSERQERIEVVNDQIGTPTYTLDLSRAIATLLEKDLWGIFHISNSGQCSWYDFACEILRQAGIDEVEVIPISSADLTRPARRPLYSVLSNEKLRREGGCEMRPWQEALKDYLSERERSR